MKDYQMLVDENECLTSLVKHYEKRVEELLIENSQLYKLLQEKHNDENKCSTGQGTVRSTSDC